MPDLLKITDYGLGLAVPRLPFVQAMKARKADRYLSPEFVEGSDVVDKIKGVKTGSSGFHQDVPKEDVIIERAEIC